MIQYDLMRKCETLMDLYNEMKADASAFENPRVLFAAASLFLTAGIEYDSAEVRRCRLLLRRYYGIFSRFRSTESFIVACKMSLADDAEKYLEKLSDLSEDLKVGALENDRIVLAAMILEDNLEGREPDYLVAKTKRIYRRMRSTHKLLTSGEDLPLAALMAVSEKDGQSIYDDAEIAYKEFHRDLYADNNTIQLLSHIVSLYYGNIPEMCQKLIDIADILHRRKHALGTGVRLGILGPLADMPYSPYELAEDIIDADQFLKEFKPFRGVFGLDAKDRAVFATVCAMSANLDAESAQRTAMVSTSVELTIILQITMAMVCVACV